MTGSGRLSRKSSRASATEWLLPTDPKMVKEEACTA